MAPCFPETIVSPSAPSIQKRPGPIVRRLGKVGYHFLAPLSPPVPRVLGPIDTGAQKVQWTNRGAQKFPCTGRPWAARSQRGARKRTGHRASTSPLPTHRSGAPTPTSCVQCIRTLHCNETHLLPPCDRGICQTIPSPSPGQQRGY